jgi:hypothetical protein
MWRDLHEIRPWWDLLVLLVDLAVIGWPVAKRPTRFPAEPRTAVPGGLSLIVTVHVPPSLPPGAPSASRWRRIRTTSWPITSPES